MNSSLEDKPSSTLDSQVHQVIESIQQEVVKSLSSQQLDTSNLELVSDFKERKKILIEKHKSFINQHPELKDLMADYTQLLLLRKPDNVYEFTKEYFSTK